jgi:regulator of sigma E protease
MQISTNILAFVFVLSFLIFFHEFGHFLVAKLFKFPIEVFSIGFGKRLFGVKRNGTDYRISLVPLGGYVKIVGLGPDESDVVAGEALPTLRGTRWQRFLVMLAGPAVNLVLALLLTAGAFAIGITMPKYADERPVVKHVDAGSPAEKAGIRIDDVVVELSGKPVTTWREVETHLGLAPRAEIPVVLERGGEKVSVVIRPEPQTKYDIGYTGLNPFLAPVIGTLVKGYPGEKAGLQVGDRIVAIGGVPIEGYFEIVRRVREASKEFGAGGPKPIAFEIERGGKRLALEVTPRLEGGSWRIGFTPRYELVKRKLPFLAAIGASWTENLRQTAAVGQTVRRMVSGSGSMRQLSGPVDIAKFSGEAVRTGAAALLGFMGLLSLQLGLLNLLPIPLLDGGQLFVLTLEGIVRRDFSIKIKERLLQAGFVFLVLLMVSVLALDIAKNLGF